MALPLALILIGVVLLLLGMVVWPALGMHAISERNARLAGLIGGGFLMLVGMILALASIR
jgi:hypothetical protein